MTYNKDAMTRLFFNSRNRGIENGDLSTFQWSFNGIKKVDLNYSLKIFILSVEVLSCQAMGFQGRYVSICFLLFMFVFLSIEGQCSGFL